MIKRYYKEGQVYDGKDSTRIEYVDAEEKPAGYVDNICALLPEGHPKKVKTVRKAVKKAVKKVKKVEE